MLQCTFFLKFSVLKSYFLGVPTVCSTADPTQVSWGRYFVEDTRQENARQINFQKNWLDTLETCEVDNSKETKRIHFGREESQSETPRPGSVLRKNHETGKLYRQTSFKTPRLCTESVKHVWAWPRRTYTFDSLWNPFCSFWRKHWPKFWRNAVCTPVMTTLLPVTRSYTLSQNAFWRYFCCFFCLVIPSVSFEKNLCCGLFLLNACWNTFTAGSEKCHLFAGRNGEYRRRQCAKCESTGRILRRKYPKTRLLNWICVKKRDLCQNYFQVIKRIVRSWVQPQTTADCRSSSKVYSSAIQTRRSRT